MANTYSQLYVHLIFAVKRRRHSLLPDGKEELHKYITGIIRNKECRLIAINSMPDHIHIFMSVHPKLSISELVRDIKSNSSAFIKSKNKMTDFSWQEGYGAFSYSRSQCNDVIQYILDQEEHHKKRSFREEYIALLKAFNIEYDERYIFTDPE